MARIQELTMNRGSRMLLLLALGAGLLAAVLVFVALNNSSDSGSGTTAPATTTAIVVAKQDIPVGTEIKEDMLKVIQMSPDLVIKSGFSDTQTVVGQKARVAIVTGEQVSSTKVGVQTKTDGLDQVVPAGKRAVAVEVQELTAVGGNLLPGQKVDLIGVFKIRDVPNVGEVICKDCRTYVLRTRTILQNVEVLSVAQNAQQPVPASDTAAKDSTSQTATSGQLPKEPEKDPHAGTVTVALDPDQVQQVVSAQQIAERVWADLRPFGDNQTPDRPTHDVIVVGQD